MDRTFLLYFVLPVIIGVLVLVLGVILWIVAARRKKKIGEIEIGDWETTGGKILSSRVEKRESQVDHKKGTLIDITYGNSVFPGISEKFDEKASQEILNKYPLNTYVPVRYNPDDPSVSALMPHPGHPDYIQMAGYLLTGFGLSVCCFTSFMAFIIVGNIK